MNGSPRKLCWLTRAKNAQVVDLVVRESDEAVDQSEPRWSKMTREKGGGGFACVPRVVNEFLFPPLYEVRCPAKPTYLV